MMKTAKDKYDKLPASWNAFIRENSGSAAVVTVSDSGDLHLPILQALMPDSRIQPPPLYNQAGCPSHRVQRDVAMREKRILSRGETKHPTRPKGKAKPATVLADRVAAAAKIQDHFSIEIRAAQKKKRSKCICSHCGKAEGHNSAKFPNRLAGNVDTDVQPGMFLVGKNCSLLLLVSRNNAIVY
ncbi:Hypothetical protein PHPALM_20449 [Phytophthora palmivora]|uniref:Uncharacterized protein n=1 Tax=Phytophthora palmivora TaxID=4796 RepID=A0A2P4XEV5_9STRA|nr:Hypothetical protein PHPALM_20449 [Phytophthora palmivora]